MFEPDIERGLDVGFPHGMVIGADGRCYMAGDEALAVLSPDGTWSTLPVAYSRMSLSPSGHFLVAELDQDPTDDNHVHQVVVLDLDGNVIAELGDGVRPVWSIAAG